MATVAEQITALEAARQSKAAQIGAVVQKSIDDSRSMDAVEQTEFDELEAEISSVDEDLIRLRKFEKIQSVKAVPIAGANNQQAADSRSGIVTTLRRKEVPGIAFAKYAQCIAAAKGNLTQAAVIAEKRFGEDQRIATIIKADVESGSTLSGNWAAALVGEESGVFADFIEFLRPMTILGKFGMGGIPSLRAVPFRVPLIGETSGGQGYWVGEGDAKPLTKSAFTRTTLEPLKVANIAVITEELARYSSPSALMLIRDTLAKALQQTLDEDFIDPASTATSVKPASITAGVSPIASTGNDADSVRADIKALFEAFISANNAPTDGVWVMSNVTALGLSLMVNALGQEEFAGINMNGGTLKGLPVIASQYVPTATAGSLVILVNASDIYLGDEGGVMVDMSREATLEMSDIPAMDSVTPTAPTGKMVSMFQTNSIALRAERIISWSKRRASAVAYLDEVNWGSAGS